MEPNEEQGVASHLEKDLFDHTTDYFRSLNGAWDALRVGNHVGEVVCSLPNLSAPQRVFASKVSDVLGTSGTALSLPRTLTDAANFRKSLQNIRSVQAVSPNHPAKDKLIAQAYKQSIFEGFNLVNTASQGALFLDQTSLMDLGKHLTPVTGLYNLTSIGADAIELADASGEIIHYNSLSPTTPDEKLTLQERKVLSWMKVVKSVPSIAGAALALIGIVFSWFLTPVVGLISLGLSVVWLVMKITSNVYEKVIAANQNRRKLNHGQI
ncbi:MAG TPA: hypothetical protein VGJ00_07110 [Rhabdochlamydiaceae bacterium]